MESLASPYRLPSVFGHRQIQAEFLPASLRELDLLRHGDNGSPITINGPSFQVPLAIAEGSTAFPGTDRAGARILERHGKIGLLPGIQSSRPGGFSCR